MNPMNLRFKPLGVPFLILSDDAASTSGLARVARDVASLVTSMPQFRVGYLGRGGVGHREFPWMQYGYPAETGQWGEEYLSQVWRDFAGSEPGIVWSNWDLSRMLWFGQPDNLPQHLAQFLGSGRQFEKWGYIPIDGIGPDAEKLPYGVAMAGLGYDRIAAASDWGRSVLRRTCPAADWLPHGVWMSGPNAKFWPRSNARASIYQNAEDKIIVGCVMANQARKCWPVAFEAAALLKREYGNRLHFWCHTDVPIHYWNLYALAMDYEMTQQTEITTSLNDDMLALRYSACDCTVLPSEGEGFGFPIAESMACGVACVVTDYAGGAELVEEDCRAKVVALRIDTCHNVARAVLSAKEFAEKVATEVERRLLDSEERVAQLREQVRHLDWTNLAIPWKRWLLEGLQ
jgi:glycosyltransferase involved in cell wall biosynthesis